MPPDIAPPKHPVPGRDYPRTLRDFDEWFPSEDACLAYLERLRWPGGFTCPGCGAKSSWKTGRGLLRCAACQRQTSVIAGTVLEGTRKPLRTWFQAIWYVTNQKQGVSALGLQRVLGLGSYQTAWTWLHKLRRAMVRPGRDRLRGLVEVDETYVSEVEGDDDRRPGHENSIVVIAVEVLSPKGFGRVRLATVPSASRFHLGNFVCDVVEPGSTVRTDGWSGYADLETYGYRHVQKVLLGGRTPAHVAMPGVHRVASLLKRWLLGTHQGAVSEKHLNYYLDEFAFRFNRRSSRARGLLFYRLLQQAAEVEPAPYRHLVAAKRRAHHNR